MPTTVDRSWFCSSTCPTLTLLVRPYWSVTRADSAAVKAGDRVAQLILEKIETAPVLEVEVGWRRQWIGCLASADPARTWTLPSVAQAVSARQAALAPRWLLSLQPSGMLPLPLVTPPSRRPKGPLDRLDSGRVCTLHMTLPHVRFTIHNGPDNGDPHGRRL